MSGGLPGLGGSNDGVFGHVGEAGHCYARMAKVLQGAGEVCDKVAADLINVEKNVEKIASLVTDLTKAFGSVFEQEHLSMINMVSAINTGGSGSTGGNRFSAKWIMEHKVIMNLRMVSGEKSLFRQWHQRLITALCQVGRAHAEIIQQLVRETDLDRECGKVVENLRGHYGDEFRKVS
jgi:hypothetical protein